MSLREYWRSENVYERFETVVSLILIGLIGVLIVVLVARLVMAVVEPVPSGLEALVIADVQPVFGLVLTVLIVLKFSRSIAEPPTTPRVIVRTRAVIVIAVLTVVRKLILLDVTEASATTLMGLAAVIVALGGALLVRGGRARAGG